MTFDPSTVSSLILLAVAFGAAFLVALWLSLIFWTYRDIRARSRDPLLRILAALVVAILFLPGILVYLIMRPPRTMEEEYQQSLEEEALLQSIEETPLCPGCSRHIQETWTVCPNCQTRLRKTCHHCGKLMELPWNICAFCGTPVPGAKRENLTMEDALQTLPPVEEVSINDLPPVEELPLDDFEPIELDDNEEDNS